MDRYHIHNMIRWRVKVLAHQKIVSIPRYYVPKGKMLAYIQELNRKGYNIQYSVL